MRPFLPALLATATLSWAGESSSLPLIAVLPVTGSSLDSGARAGLSASLATELSRTGKFRLLEREGLGQLLAEQGLAGTGALDEQETCKRLGKLLAVDQLVLGSVSQVGNTWSLSARLVDATTGEVRRSATRNSKGSADGLLAEGTSRVSRDLAELEARTRPWIWVAGGVALTAGATAAILLASDDGATDEPVPPTSGPVDLKVQVP